MSPNINSLYLTRSSSLQGISLWKKTSPKTKSPYLTHPFCEGCNRLFTQESTTTMANKYKRILWLLTREAENLENDVSFDEKNYRLVHTSMIKRAKRMRNQFPIYDHKDWTFLKSEKELRFEYENIYPNDSPAMINERVKNFIDTDPNIKVVKPKPVTEAGIASSKKLRDLVHERDGRDALLGHKRYLRDASAFNGLSFDHLESCSQVRFVNGSYSIGDIQI